MEAEDRELYEFIDQLFADNLWWGGLEMYMIVKYKDNLKNAIWQSTLFEPAIRITKFLVAFPWKRK